MIGTIVFSTLTQRAPCGMTVNNDIDDDSATKHSDSHNTAYTAGTPTDDPELLEQFDGNLEDADASASQVYASASRTF